MHEDNSDDNCATAYTVVCTLVVSRYLGNERWYLEWLIYEYASAEPAY